MTNYPGMIQQVEAVDGFVEIVQDPYFQLEEISGTTPLADLQAEMLDPLARELARLIRERGWRRPRQRVYPARPKEGIRATRPGELLHIDVTIIKLIDGSMIEAWWRSLKSNWIYLNQLHSFAALERLISFYVSEHNSNMPHAAFHGQTPDEVYFRRGDDVPDQLAEAARLA